MLDTNSADVAHDDDNEINLTPMLDVVFIMLIFFIVTASFIKEAGIAVDRPESNANPTPGNGILITIGENNGIWMDRRLIDPHAVRANIEFRHAGDPTAGVLIRAHSASHTDTLVQVMDASRAAGVYDVAIAE